MLSFLVTKSTQQKRQDSGRKRLYSPSGAGNQRQNVPEPVEQRAQSSLAPGKQGRGGERKEDSGGCR